MNRKLSRPQTPRIQLNCCWFWSEVRWAALPRAEGVALYVGLGAYRIGEGDGSTADTGEWRSGHALADQLDALEELGITGAGLYRYGSLWANTDWPDLARAERDALAQRWGVTSSPGY